MVKLEDIPSIALHKTQANDTASIFPNKCMNNEASICNGSRARGEM